MTQIKSQAPKRKGLWPLAVAGVAAVILAGTIVLDQMPQQAERPRSGQMAIVASSSPHSYSKEVAQNTVVKMGQVVPDFTFASLDGQRERLSQWSGQMTLLFFADTTCPCVKAYDGRMKALHQEFGPRGLRIAYVFPDARESVAQVRAMAKQQAYPWPCVRDEGQKVLRALDVQCTTEAFLLDRSGRLRYHGRVDESTFDAASATRHDLKNAIVALLDGKPVPRRETKAFACTIPRISVGSPKKST